MKNPDTPILPPFEMAEADARQSDESRVRRLIVAHGRRGEIGADDDLLWRMPADMKHFRELTDGASLIMGGRTWRSIGRVLPGREMVVVTRGEIDTPEVIAVRSLAEAFERASRERIYVIGGGEIYHQALAGGYVDALDVTEIDAEFPQATVYYHPPTDGWREVSRESHQADEANPYDYDFVTYLRDR